MIEIDVAIDTYDAYEIDRRELGVQRWTGRKDKELVGGIRVSFFFGGIFFCLFRIALFCFQPVCNLIIWI